MHTLLALLLLVDSWSASATSLGYSVPEQPDFLMVVAPVDVRWFHVEGRYNYEGLDSGSVFLGLNAGVGDRLRLDATGMIGTVFGDTAGVAPAMRVTLTWWKLDLFSENEYVINVRDPDVSYFYSWSELGFSPLRWLRLGAVVQRTRAVDADLDLLRGALVGVSPHPALSLSLYQLGWDSPTYVVALGASY